MKLHYPPAQFDIECVAIQFVANEGELNDARMFILVRHRFIATRWRHITPLNQASGATTAF
jgi:hypothetical protein